jgi:Na+/H+-dicarboxylate symporter
VTNDPSPPRRRVRPLVVLTALMVGLVIGGVVEWQASPEVARRVATVELLGTAWINAIRMTVIPLVATLTIVAVATSDTDSGIGRVGGYAVGVFATLCLAGGFFAMLLTPLSMNWLQITPDVAERLQASAAGAASAPVAMPSLAQRVIDIVPVNPIKAAADGAILPVVVFSLALGFALTKVPSDKREAFVTLCRALSDALLVLVEWVLVAAPVGVFALAVGLGVKMGAAAAGALLHYVLTLATVLFLFTLLLYPVVAFVGGVSLRRFATAALPAQAVAFTTRSSLAALPTMIVGARDALGLGPRMTGFVIPLAVSIFRANVPIAWVVGFVFLGKLYGVPVAPGALAMLVLTSTLISFSVPGIPSASLFLIAPVLIEYGIPTEGVGILIAIDAIPDMFKTLANVTAHLTSAVVVNRAAPVRPT